ncbi:MAG: hypothetical protein ACREMY_07655, partial [bacterium]
LYGIRDAGSRHLWWTRVRPQRRLQWRMDSAVLLQWNHGTTIETLRVPEGQSLIGLEGTARGQGPYVGGGDQAYIPDVPEGFRGMDIERTMAIDTRCSEISRVLDDVHRFIEQSWATKGGSLPQWVFERDVEFLNGAREAVRICSRAALHSLVEDMRGLSHYFGSYADAKELDALLDRLFTSVRDVLSEI